MYFERDMAKIHVKGHESMTYGRHTGFEENLVKDSLEAWNEESFINKSPT